MPKKRKSRRTASQRIRNNISRRKRLSTQEWMKRLSESSRRYMEEYLKRIPGEALYKPSESPYGSFRDRRYKGHPRPPVHIKWSDDEWTSGSGSEGQGKEASESGSDAIATSPLSTRESLLEQTEIPESPQFLLSDDDESEGKIGRPPPYTELSRKQISRRFTAVDKNSKPEPLSIRREHVNDEDEGEGEDATAEENLPAPICQPTQKRRSPSIDEDPITTPMWLQQSSRPADPGSPRSLLGTISDSEPEVELCLEQPASKKSLYEEMSISNDTQEYNKAKERITPQCLRSGGNCGCGVSRSREIKYPHDWRSYFRPRTVRP